MADQKFDILVIGAGPGGYVAAIKAAQLGYNTALVEKRAELGGTCLNVGCIPSKALLHSTEIYHFLHQKGSDHGIQTGKLSVDIPALMKKKEDVVSKLNGGVRQIIKQRGITVFNGHGKLLGGGKVVVGDATIEAEHILIATGSSSVELPFLKFDGQTIVSSDEAIAFDKVPKKLAVVGAGAIGLELGSVWARLGSEVTVVEMFPQIAPSYDEDISKLAQRALKKEGITFELGAKVSGMEKEGRKRFLAYTDKKGNEQKLECDKILIAVGRRPHTADLGLEAAGIELDEKGRIPVDEHFRTKAAGIYAVGDVIPGPMLAHKAEEEGVACVELIAGKAGHVNYAAIPNVVYTDPEIASVGIGEKAAKEQGLNVKVGKFPLAANGRAIASDATDGLVKVIADDETDRLLGVQILARNASELIAAAVTHLEYGGSAEDLARTVTAHPTLGEALKEAAMATDKASIHSL